MSLSIKTRKSNGITILDMSGRLTIGEPVSWNFVTRYAGLPTTVTCALS